MESVRDVVGNDHLDENYPIHNLQNAIFHRFRRVAIREKIDGHYLRPAVESVELLFYCQFRYVVDVDVPS